jgi:glycosyltransferase involved in cell wall biosynthesis
MNLAGPGILVVGNNSGAMHGSLVMTRYLVRALEENGCRVTVLDRAFSRKNTEIGKIRLHKLFRAAGMELSALRLGFGPRFRGAFYLPASLPPALTFDYFFHPMVRRVSPVWIGYSHMVRYRQLKEGGSRFQSRHAQNFWKSFQRCIGPSEAVLEDLESVGVSRSAMRVLLNCLPPGWTFSSPDGARERYSGAPSSLVYLSTVRARKGIWDLLEAYETILAGVRPAPPLDIIGPETDAGIFEAIREWTASRNLQDRVRLLGPMSHQEIEARLGLGAPIMVFPTRREEAFGLVLAEAMSKGVPVVATRIGAVPEVLDGGAAGVLAEPSNPASLAEAVIGILTDTDRRVAFSLAGLEASRKYSFAEYARGVGEVLDWAGIADP